MLAQDKDGVEHLVHEGGLEAWMAKEQHKIHVITEHFNENPVKYFGSWAWVTKPYTYKESENYILMYELMTAQDVWGRQMLQHLTPRTRYETELEISRFRCQVKGNRGT